MIWSDCLNFKLSFHVFPALPTPLSFRPFATMEELETLAAIYPELEYDTDTLSGSLEITASFEEPVKVVFGDADTQHE